MKRYSPAYQWEDSDGPVTVENIAELAARFQMEEHRRHSTDDPPLLVLSHRQYVEFRADLGALWYLSRGLGEGRFRTMQIYGFHVITTDEEG